MKKLPILTRTLLSTKIEFTKKIQYWIFNADTDRDLKLIDDYSKLDISTDKANSYVIGSFKDINIMASDLLLYGNPYDISDEIKIIIENKILNQEESYWCHAVINDKDGTYLGIAEKSGISYFNAVLSTLGKPSNIIIIKINIINRKNDK
jgi:hypothetical protein